jgi:hypothetical protein
MVCGPLDPSCDIYLWGKLKSVVFSTIYMTWRLSNRIFRKQIRTRELQQVSQNLFTRIQACLTADNRHFEHLL